MFLKSRLKRKISKIELDIKCVKTELKYSEEARIRLKDQLNKLDGSKFLSKDDINIQKKFITTRLNALDSNIKEYKSEVSNLKKILEGYVKGGNKSDL